MQQGVAHPRVQGPQSLDLWFRRMQPTHLGVLGADQLEPVHDRGIAGQSDGVPIHEQQCLLATSPRRLGFVGIVRLYGDHIAGRCSLVHTCVRRRQTCHGRSKSGRYVG
jgi:hypothetical protein